MSEVSWQRMVGRFFANIMRGLEAFCNLAERHVLSCLAVFGFLMGMMRLSEPDYVWGALLILLYCQTMLLSDIRHHLCRGTRNHVKGDASCDAQSR